MIGVTVIGGLGMVAAGFLAARVGTGFARDIRQATFDKVESFSLNEIDKFSTASLITRSTNDVQQIQMVLIMLLRMALMAPMMAVGAIIKALDTAPNMTWIIALAVIILFGVIMVLFAFALPKFKLLQKMVDKLNLVTRENLTGLRIVRAFTNEKYEEKKFEETNRNLTKINLFVNRVMVVMMPVMMLIFNATTLLIIWVGAHLIADDGLEIGNMLAFMQYAMQIIMSFLMISMIFILVPRASVSAGRIAEVLQTKLSIKTPKKTKLSAKNVRGLVEFKDVTFTYPGAEQPVLTDVSFTAKPGQTTAFIGSTGSGKSTLINLVPRFYDVTAGTVLVDGVDVRQLDEKILRNKIGLVPQKGVLFSGTVKSNISYGMTKINDRQIRAAARIAQADDFVKKLDGKFDAPIAQGGSNVSGGQKQRLSIARAVVRDPEIYIFDDSFSALDFKTDAALRKALAPITKKSTVLIVAQRIGTIKHADQIIVMEEGRVVGVGQHKQLLRDCAVYREIAASQLSEKELTAELQSMEGKV
jgi:ATP-binding cassette subfamily B protein